MSAPLLTSRPRAAGFAFGLIAMLLTGCSAVAETEPPEASMAPPTVAPTPTPVPMLTVPDSGERSHSSSARGKEVGYWAYLPAFEGVPAPGLPVLYLLHGAWDSHRSWPDQAGEQLQQLADQHGLVIITPDGEPFGWYVDSPLQAASQIESYLLRELLPEVERSLPVDPARRAIAGLSMGGHGAFSLSLRHPGTFVSASAMSGIVDLTQHPDQFELADVLGPLEDNRARWESVSSHQLLAPLDEAPLPLYFSVGDEDPWALEENRALHEMLTERGIAHRWEEGEGGHLWPFWLGQLPLHVAFHAGHLGGSAP